MQRAREKKKDYLRSANRRPPPRSRKTPNELEREERREREIEKKKSISHFPFFSSLAGSWGALSGLAHAYHHHHPEYAAPSRAGRALIPPPDAPSPPPPPPPLPRRRRIRSRSATALRSRRRRVPLTFPGPLPAARCPPIVLAPASVSLAPARGAATAARVSGAVASRSPPTRIRAFPYGRVALRVWVALVFSAWLSEELHGSLICQGAFRGRDADLRLPAPRHWAVS